VTRDYAFDIDRGPSGKGAPLLSVYGGKLTTYRRLAEHALGKLGRDVPMGPAWTKTAPLPGGEGPAPDASFLPEKQAARLRSAYGARLARLLGDAKNAADLGEDFGFGLTAREADFLIETEWARSAADILDRRSKLGLMVSEAQRQRLEAYVKSRL
jgi:glycerol-3-phosphate dehydrogenase